MFDFDDREQINQLKIKVLSVLKPPPKMKMSNWIEGNVKLPAGVTATPGSIRLWPFQRDIANAIGNPNIERVTLMKPVRVGFTQLLTSCLAGYVVNDPAPILAVLPTEADCRDYAVSDIEPTFEASPVLANMLSTSNPKDRSTLLSRKFPGGSLKIVAAKSPRNLRRHNTRILFMDEVDGMEVGAEGSPLLLAERRTLQFANRKIVVGSTPTNYATSFIASEYEKSNQQICEIPCPECDEYFELLWDHITWPENEPEKAHAICPCCGSILDEAHKPNMIDNLRWRATKPEITNHYGFRLNALISPLANASWGKLACEYVQANEDPAAVQVFHNTILGKPWESNVQDISESDLKARAEPFSVTDIPENILVLVAGVDIQHNRNEMVILGFDRDNVIHILEHQVHWGAWDSDEQWKALDVSINRKFKHPLGGGIKLDCVAIDSGDGRTQKAVYDFCRPRLRKKVFPIKGAGGFSRRFIQKSNHKDSMPLWIIGVDSVKSHIMERIGRADLMKFSDTLEPIFYEQLLSEQKTVSYSRGQPIHMFKRIPGRDAEVLDCVTYAIAARQILNIDFDQRTDMLKRDLLSKENITAKRVRKSKFMS